MAREKIVLAKPAQTDRLTLFRQKRAGSPLQKDTEQRVFFGKITRDDAEPASAPSKPLVPPAGTHVRRHLSSRKKRRRPTFLSSRFCLLSLIAAKRFRRPEQKKSPIFFRNNNIKSPCSEKQGDLTFKRLAG